LCSIQLQYTIKGEHTHVIDVGTQLVEGTLRSAGAA